MKHHHIVDFLMSRLTYCLLLASLFTCMFHSICMMNICICLICPVKQKKIERNMSIFSYPSILTFVLGA